MKRLSRSTYITEEKEDGDKKRRALLKMRDKGMEDTIRALSEKAVATEELGDTKETERLTDKIKKLKKQLKDEQGN